MEQEAIICSVFLLLLLVLVRRALVLYNLSTVAIDADICLSLRVMVEKLQVAEKPRGEHLKNDVCMYVRSTRRTPRRAWAFPRPQVAGHPFNTV